MMGMVDKLFPPLPDPDPAKLVPARTAAAAMWPNGAYGSLMTGMMGTIYDRVMQMKPSELASAASGKPAAAGTAAEQSLHDAALAKDPYFDERFRGRPSSPDRRSGAGFGDPRSTHPRGACTLDGAPFDQQQLADISAFFATPNGHALATQYVQLWVDPDMMRAMVGTMPEMMKLMPDAMQKVKAAAAKFPEPKKTDKAPTKAAMPSAKP